MSKEVYTIDGKRYEVEVKESSEGKQKLVINGQEITLKSAPVKDNTGKEGLNVELEIIENANSRYDGPNISEINAVMQERVERNSATQMERVAVYQQDYNHKATAEALADGKSMHDADLLKLTKAQIYGQQPLPDIKKRFPWAYASFKERAMDIMKQSLSEEAKHRVDCRRYLKEQKDVYFDNTYQSGNKMIIKDRFAEQRTIRKDLHNDLAMQRKVSKEKPTLNKEDEATQRLAAAAAEKKPTKKNSKTPIRPKTLVDQERA